MPSVKFEKLLRILSRASEQSSPFRRWTTGSGAGSSYRHHDHRTNIYNKQMSEGSPAAGGGVARWSLGLEQLLLVAVTAQPLTVVFTLGTKVLGPLEGVNAACPLFLFRSNMQSNPVNITIPLQRT
ncbi:unnamed protein product [Plutella xylostella]|uniref:(diamondback moth) hypothetical protein n=1 Tax=Plutella xylostella TaxID=51655 RepID=A0A8S4FR66_PLUXY|nr:unnamed protein product [Plutella xylostella]